MTTEETEHALLKKYANQVLLRLGFTTSEMQEEFCVKFEGMRERLIVDVVGISPNRRVAIECGHTPSDKIIKLQMYFDEVILLPYLKSKVSDVFLQDGVNFAQIIRQQEDKILEQESKIALMTKEIAEMKQEIEQAKRATQNRDYEVAKDFVYPFFTALYLADPKFAWAVERETEDLEIRRLLNTLEAALPNLESWPWVHKTIGGWERKPDNWRNMKDELITNLVALLKKKDQDARV